MIKYDYTVTVTGNTAKLDKDIYLFRGNKNVHYYFAIKNASFNFKGTTDLIEKTNAINAAVTVVKPNAVEVANAIAPVENGLIHLKVTEDLIDEEVEVGDFDLVFDLFDDTDGAVTIPKVIGQFHVLERPCTTPISELAVATNTTNEVDYALTDYAITTYAEPVASTNADGTFAKKTWVAKEKITTAELNRIEEGISDVSSQCKDIANVGARDKLNGKFKSTSLEDILLEIYNKIYEQVTNPWSDIIGTDIPEVQFTCDTSLWSTMTKETAIDVAMSYKSDSINWNGVANIKWQGSSSLSYDKKNFTIKLYEDDTKAVKQKVNMNNWGNQNKFCLKANYIDHSHARNIISAKIWSEIVSSRSDYSTLPQELRESPNNCAIDGFPVKVTVNGVYQGIYTWNIPKDAWMFNMDDTNPNHAVLCAEINNNGNNNLSNACEFRENANINGADWSLEIPDILNNNIKVSFNELINCIKNTTDNQFIYNIEKYLDIQSAIDYYIFQYYICGLDGLAKNLIMMTYDGIKWLCSSYDMDSTFGLYFDGSKFVNSNYQCPEQYQETNSLLWQRIEKCFAKQLKERYTKLRTNILSVEHITKLFNDFMSIIGNELYAKDLEVYPSIPQGNINHLQQITDFVTARSAYVDSEINSLVEYDFSQVPVTTLELDKQNVNLSISSDIQNIDLSSITKYSGREIYNSTEDKTNDTSKILTDFIEIDYSKINIYMSDSANDNTRIGYYSSRDAKNPSSTSKLTSKEGSGYISNSVCPYIKLMSDDNFANEKLISIDKNYIESMLKDMDLSSLDSTNQSDKYIPVTVSKGDVVFCKPSKAGYWNAIGTTNDGLNNAQNNNTANLIAYPINKDITTVYIKIQNSLLTSDDTLKYAILHSKDLKVNTTQNITATLSPSDATNQNVTWATDNANVELVPNGLNCTIKAKAIGSSVITCTSEDTTNGTISDTCNIIIN